MTDTYPDTPKVSLHGQALERVYDLPWRQVRAELEQVTDTVFAKRHGIGRASASKLRRELGVPPHPQGRRTLQEKGGASENPFLALDE